MKILLADDHEVLRNTIKVFLLNDFPNAEFIEVNNGYDLQIFLKESRFNIVISDFNMPGPCVIETLLSLRKSGNQTKVIIITMSSFYVNKKLLESGANAVIDKGDISEELIPTMEALLIHSNTVVQI